MAELKQWFKRVRCRLTGGHMYRDMGIVTRYEPITDRYWFGNRCIKCGQFNTWDVDLSKSGQKSTDMPTISPLTAKKTMGRMLRGTADGQLFMSRTTIREPARELLITA